MSLYFLENCNKKYSEIQVNASKFKLLVQDCLILHSNNQEQKCSTDIRRFTPGTPVSKCSPGACLQL